MTFMHIHSGFHIRAGRGLTVILFMAACLLLVGCDKTGQMENQPRYNPLSASDIFPNGQSARTFPEGSVPYTAQGSANDPALTGNTLKGDPLGDIPVPVTKELVAMGQDRYNTYCMPCHGATGKGDGKAVSLFGFPKPPDLLSDDAKKMPNGEIFDVITNGRDKMYSYGYRVKAPERWAVIAYIRAMQMKNGAVTVNDLTPDQLTQLGKQP